MLQTPVISDYEIVCGDRVFKLKNTSTIKAYMKAVEVHRTYHRMARCYICCNGRRAAYADFEVENNKMRIK